MRKEIHVGAEGVVPATQRVVYRLLRDSTTWPRWCGIGACEMIEGGSKDLHDVGAVRVFRTWPLTVVEKVVELIPERRNSYVLISGMAMRQYRAVVDLSTTPDGKTKIVWRSSFYPKLIGTGWFFRILMKRVLQAIVKDLVRVGGQKGMIERMLDDADLPRVIGADEQAKSVNNRNRRQEHP